MDSKYISIKLISGEEVIATYLSETDYEISVMFPMVVKYIPRSQGSRIMEQVSLAPFTYFANTDEMTFSKSVIIFQKELNPSFIQNYESSVDIFLDRMQEEPYSPAAAEELKQITDKLKILFRNNIEEELDIVEEKVKGLLRNNIEEDELYEDKIVCIHDISKLIH